MSLKTKKKPFRFTFKVALRWVIFSAIIYFLIIYFSSQKPNYKIPKINVSYFFKEETQKTFIENFNKNPTVIFIQEKFNEIKGQTQYFPQNQIKEIKKMVITNVYQDMMKNIDQK